jgi:hypothetical protein
MADRLPHAVMIALAESVALHGGSVTLGQMKHYHPDDPNCSKRLQFHAASH